MSLREIEMEKVNVREKFGLFNEVYVPKIVGDLNGQYVKVIKFHGPYVWHDHELEDELFFVIKGSINIEFRDSTITLNEGEFLIVPKGVEHRPVAYDEAWVLIFEPEATINTGKVEHYYTRTELDRI